MGRYCSYLLPKQALANRTENITKHGERVDEKRCRVKTVCSYCSLLDDGNKCVRDSPQVCDLGLRLEDVHEAGEVVKEEMNKILEKLSNLSF